MSKYRKFDLEAVKRGARICNSYGKEPLEYHVWSTKPKPGHVAISVIWEGPWFNSDDYLANGKGVRADHDTLYLLPVKEKRWAVHSSDGTHLGVYCYEGDVRDWFKGPGYSIAEYEIEVWE